MAKEVKIENLIKGIRSLDGQVLGEGLKASKLRLSPDDKGAVINDIADKYERKELSKEFLEEMQKITNFSDTISISFVS